MASSSWMIGRFFPLVRVWTLAEADHITLIPFSVPAQYIVGKDFPPLGTDVYRYFGPV